MIPRWLVLAAYAVIVVMHLVGLRRMLTARSAESASRTRLLSQAALFQLGLLLAMLSIVSPLAYWSTIYIWLHAIQDLLLGFVAAGLIVLGAPWQPLRRAVPGSAAGTDSTDPDRPERWHWWQASPVGFAAAFNVAFLVWQEPTVLGAARTSTALTYAQYASMLGLGVLFWLQLVGSAPSRPRPVPLRRLGIVVGTVIVGTVIGMILVFSSRPIYPAFAHVALRHIMTVLDDQQLAGAVLWMGMLPSMITAGIAVCLRWLEQEESGDMSEGLDRLLSTRKSSWASRAGLR
jgi:putative membrane protein